MDCLDDMNALISSFREFKQTIQEKLKVEFKLVISKLFENNPELKAIVWTQYTPYFNDGDECVFRVGEVGFTNAIEEEDLNNIGWGEYEGDNENIVCFTSYFNIKYANKKEKEYLNLIDVEACKQLGSFMTSSEMEDVMLATFGNHVRVVATREGFSVEEYQHD